MNRRGLIDTLALTFAAPFGGARAENFPTRTITLTAPSVPGGSTDMFCRVLAEAVARRKD